MIGEILKTLLLALAVVVLVSCTQSQVQPVPQSVRDSIAALRSDVTILKSAPVNLQPVWDSLAAQRTRLGNLESKAIEFKTGKVAFVGTNWRLAIYVQGLTPSWSAVVTPVYTVEAPALDYLTRIVKTDSIIVLRNQNGTSGLNIEYVAITP
jgi:hypothetical protein